MRWLTAKELADLTPEDPPALIPGFLVYGSITEISAKIKAGKTTLISRMVKAVLEGGEFLTKRAEQSPVIFLTEERQSSFRAALDRAGLLTNENLHILHIHEAFKMSWQDIALEVATKADQTAAKLIVVDTLSRWARLREEEENSAGAAAAAMEPLEIMASMGLSVFLARHSRRGDITDPTEASRGSSAFGGAADIILNLSRSSMEYSTRRILYCVSRFDNLPPRILMDLGRNGYRIVEDPEE